MSKSISLVPSVGRVVVLDAGFHVLEFIEFREHVDELAESQEVCLRYKVVFLLLVTQSSELFAEAIDGSFL